MWHGTFLWASRNGSVDFFALHLVLASGHYMTPWIIADDFLSQGWNKHPNLQEGCHISESQYAFYKIMVHILDVHRTYEEKPSIFLHGLFKGSRHTSLLLSFSLASIPLDSSCPRRKNDITMLRLKLGRVLLVDQLRVGRSSCVTE